jgi:hypothetical protein
MRPAAASEVLTSSNKPIAPKAAANGIEKPDLLVRLRGRFLVQFFCELICPNRREFIRKFFEFAPRGAFQARIRGDFSPFLAKPGIFIRRNIALLCAFRNLPHSLRVLNSPLKRRRPSSRR